MAYNEKGTPDTWGLSDMYNEDSHRIVAQSIIPYLKLLKDCTLSNIENSVCNSSSAKTIFSSFILANGMTVSIRNWNSRCDSVYGDSQPLRNTCGTVQIDINGAKPPGKSGKDKFELFYTKYGLVPFGTENATMTFEKGCNRTEKNPYPLFSANNSMYTCAAWVIYSGNLDYWKCDNLSWSGKKKCDQQFLKWLCFNIYMVENNSVNSNNVAMAPVKPNVGVIIPPDLPKTKVYSDGDAERKFQALHQDIYQSQKKISFADTKKTPKAIIWAIGATVATVLAVKFKAFSKIAGLFKKS